MMSIVAPLHDRDYLRIKGRAGKASAQIRSAAAEYGSGVLVLGFEKHEAPLVRTLLAKQMKAGRLKAIGAVVLNKQDINFGLPLVTALEYLQTFRNDWGVKPIKVDIPLQVLGQEKRFVSNEDDLALPAYVHGSARSDSGQVTVWIPPDRCIQPEWLV
jgi:hypothetical protein